MRFETVAAEAPDPDQVVRLRLEQAVQRVLDRLPDQLAQIGPEALLVQCYDGFGHGRPPICFSSRQLESCRGGPCPPSYLDAILLSKCARYCTLPLTTELSTQLPGAPFCRLSCSVADDGFIHIFHLRQQVRHLLGLLRIGEAGGEKVAEEGGDFRAWRGPRF